MRKQHTSAFKAKIVQQAIQEEKTITQIASDNGIHPNQISQWKSLVLAGLSSLSSRILFLPESLREAIIRFPEEYREGAGKGF